MKRKNHVVVLGNSALAQNTYRELQSRGQSVTCVLRQKPASDPQGDDDIVIGDAGYAETLRRAVYDKAIVILAMFEDDSENTFAVLAVRDLGGELAAMLVCGEEVTADFVLDRLLHGSDTPS